MTEEPHGKTSIGTVGTRCARGESGMRRTAIAWACITILGTAFAGWGWRMPPTQERVIITAAVALDWFGATRG
jgi:hypothetical protein